MAAVDNRSSVVNLPRGPGAVFCLLLCLWGGGELGAQAGGGVPQAAPTEKTVEPTPQPTPQPTPEPQPTPDPQPNPLPQPELPVPVPNPDEPQPTRFYWALINNDLQKIWQETRDQGAVNAPLAYGGSPLLVAALAGHREAIDFLLAEGADLNRAVDDRGVTLLTRLALDGQTDLLWYLIGQGGRWVRSPVDGSNGLHILALWPEAAPADYYIGWGFDPNWADYNGRTPLMAAARAGNLPLVEFFLKQGADPTDIDILGRTAADLAKREGHPEVVQVLEGVTEK